MPEIFGHPPAGYALFPLAVEERHLVERAQALDQQVEAPGAAAKITHGWCEEMNTFITASMPMTAQRYCGWMPAVSITLAHLAMSDLMIAPNASGGSAVVSKPSCASLARTSGMAAICAACR